MHHVGAKSLSAHRKMWHHPESTGAFAYLATSVAENASIPRESGGSLIGDPAGAALAMDKANAALSDILGRGYKTLDGLALAWSDRVASISGTLKTEISSKFYLVDGLFQTAGAFSNGYVSGVDVMAGPSISGALVGAIHTHPYSSPLNNYDVSWAYNQSLLTGRNFTFYGAKADGGVNAWDSNTVSRYPGAGTWYDYANHQRTVR